MMMLRGLWKLTWIEIKIFLREPLGAFGAIGFPVLVFLVAGRVAGSRLSPSSLAASSLIRVGLPVFASLLIAISAVLSLVTIISIYREGGILKRLRATPLHPQTILTAHVIVKLTLTAVTLGLMVLAGKRYYPVGVHVPLFSFTIALLSHCQRRSHGALCTTDRRHHPLPDDRYLGTLCPGCIAAPSASRAGARAAANLRCASAAGNLERRRVVSPRGRCSRAGRGVYRLHRDLGESVSLGVAGDRGAL
jgi:hypothetical protein